MDATTTRSMHSLIKQLKATHSQLTFVEAEDFSWSPDTMTVSYTTSTPHGPALLLHEVAHALLEHQSYQRDVELISMEAVAWEKATSYVKEHNLEALAPIDDDVVQDHLDTYREWLHARSTCPNCSATGYQTQAQHYACPACSHVWKVNEARLCALRRYSIKK